LTVWIAELQWQLQKGLEFNRRPILGKLDGIVRADALITQSGKDSAWPEADAVVGNPPFLGGKRMRNSLGDAYVKRLFAAFAGRVPAEADLVTYWFEKTRALHEAKRLKRAGLVATQAIRRGASSEGIGPHRGDSDDLRRLGGRALGCEWGGRASVANLLRC
jgi:MmeI, DNA-methyltransferase domain